MVGPGGHHIGIVVHQHHRLTGSAPLLDDPVDGCCAFRVERGGGLVQHQDWWVHGQHPGHGQSLLLATGQSRHLAIRQAGESHSFQGIGGARPYLIAG